MPAGYFIDSIWVPSVEAAYSEASSVSVVEQSGWDTLVSGVSGVVDLVTGALGEAWDFITGGSSADLVVNTDMVTASYDPTVYAIKTENGLNVTKLSDMVYTLEDEGKTELNQISPIINTPVQREAEGAKEDKLYIDNVFVGGVAPIVEAAKTDLSWLERVFGTALDWALERFASLFIQNFWKLLGDILPGKL